MTATMRAVIVAGGKGPASALQIGTVPRPVAGPGQVLVRVAAAGVNRPDIVQREGHYPPPPGASDILGLEVAGEIVEVGAGATRWRPGDVVTALLGGGGYAEYAVVDARHALPLPGGVDVVHAAALPETVFTVWSNVFERGRLASHETLLVHGANSGIGVTAIQLAKAHGARVIATARGAEKAARALELGADLAIDATADDWSGAVKDFGGADVVLDMVGGDYFPRNLEVLNADGRLVVIATLAGHLVNLDLRRLMLRRQTITASTLRARDAAEKARLAREVETHDWPWIASGRVRALVDRTFPLERVADAHRWLESGTQFGKVVLTTA
jgi:putative PIG3 family NAD(P)H quinone oxidoreductase